MENSIFNIKSIDRSKVKWEDHLFDLTPVEKIGDMYFKREDYFAPLGYGGINGSKLRQAIHLVDKYINSGGKGKVISGASVKSPQLPMCTAVATHFGLESLHVIGATTPNSSILHENVKMATWFGAEFEIIKVGYNPVLQNKVRDLIMNDKGSYHLNYGITPSPDSNDEEIFDFHMLGANQITNIPFEELDDIIIPAGSCNSCVSILMGLMVNRPVRLKNIHLVGIGPNKMKFINDRLSKLSNYIGVNLLDFDKKFEDKELHTQTENPINLYYYDLHKEGYTDYQKEVKFQYNGITFHPTYEAKCMSYVTEKLPHLIKNTSLFWIIGSKPFIKNMEFMTEELGSIPEKIYQHA